MSMVVRIKAASLIAATVSTKASFVGVGPPIARTTTLSSRFHETSHSLGASASSTSLTGSNSAPRKLNTYPEIPTDLFGSISPEEWKQRCALAVSYRIAYLHNWHENIFNHITLKVGGSDDEPDGPHFLLNDYGLGFDEITASNLLKVNLDGMLVEERSPLPANRRTVNTGKGRVFKPGYVLHSAIHAARDDVHAIWHGHDIDTTAVTQTKFGILPLSQEATYALSKGVSYHPFEGSANDLAEQPRLVKSLGPTNQILMLENHGPLVSCPTIEEAFTGMYFLTRACKFQVKALSAVGGDLSRIHLPSNKTKNEMFRRMEKFDEAPSHGDATLQKNKIEESVHDTPGLMFAYARRSAEKVFGADSIYY
jgi:ribulose-5-phosphate 4-epimerase/fuculose-1-phosphate aldolase